MAGHKLEIVPNQIFVGCPWKTVRPKYQRAIAKMNKKYPLAFILVGREQDQKAEELLEIIKRKLRSSKFAIFDATFGNANVSLEFGIAEERGIDRAIYLSTHKAGGGGKRADEAIIADLAGKNRVHYKQEPQLVKRLAALCSVQPYTKRFEAFLKKEFRHSSKGQKKRVRALALKIIHLLDDHQARRREDALQHLLGENYTRDEVEKTMRQLHRAGLILISPGRYSDVTIA